MLNIALGEVVFGGVGVGIMGLLVNAILAVFIAGLMVGRTPEYLGKKIEGREMKLATLAVLYFCVTALGFAALAAVVPAGKDAALNSARTASPRSSTARSPRPATTAAPSPVSRPAAGSGAPSAASA